MHWQTSSNRTDSTLESHANRLIQQMPSTTCNSSAYRLAIGQETVNISQIEREHAPLVDRRVISIDQQRLHWFASKTSNTMLSLSFMCFVSSILILIGLSMMDLLMKMSRSYSYDRHREHTWLSNRTTISFSINDRILNESAILICLLVILFNCFSLLIFSLEIYLVCSMTRRPTKLSK
jgi:hypothetical protein